METIKVFLLAIIQGIGEFLPVSSSGHLLAAGKLLWGEKAVGGELFTLEILLHAGTLLSILIVFRREILAILTDRKNWRIVAMLVIASIPTAVIGLFIQKKLPLLNESLPVAGLGFLFTATLLITVVRKSNGESPISEITGGETKKPLDKLTLADALFIGLFQGIAVLPGFSRSGLTIASALMRHIDRKDAATFSFLLAIPAIGGVTLLEGIQLFQKPGAFSDPRMPLWFLGVLASCLVGIISLVWLLKWLKSGALWRFAWWLIPLGLITLWFSL